MSTLKERSGNEIAIIGFAINVPGANNIDSFWDLISKKKEPISILSDEEMHQAGASKEAINDKNYINKAFILPDIDKFDAPFFSMTSRDSEILDPQQRLFLELCWKGLEHSGYTPSKYEGRIGAYAGVFFSSYAMNIYSRPELVASVGEMAIRHGNDKDYLATRLAYKLNLTGPCLSIQTSCSSSLVSVHVAAQSLIAGETDMAIAGGVSISPDQKIGYLYQEGGLTSFDGHCRPFDDNSKGTVFSNGMGVVILKRLDDAIRDNDTIYSIIIGSAINNDGANKVGFTAPSTSGQAEVIAEALAVSGVSARNIGLVEAHGTGTPLGDPIEINALTSVYRDYTNENQYCAIGSIKSNLGHLGIASGVVGLIKTCLAIHYKKLPPTINFSTPNKNIDFYKTPFLVNTELKEWVSDSSRYAAVSSFGMGGTNAHIILEEYNAPVTEEITEKNPQLFIVSAKTRNSLEAQLRDLHDFFIGNNQKSLPEIAYTLSEGRESFPHRASWSAQTHTECISYLDSCLNNSSLINEATTTPSIILAFPGQGSQFVGMGQELYEKNNIFRQAVNECLLLAEEHNCILPLRDIFTQKNAQVDINQTEIAQPALFIFGYAQTQVLHSLGVVPCAVMGHSIGELVAATIAGVFTLAAAMQIVLKRAQLMQAMPAGSMLAITTGIEEVEALIAPYTELSIAAVNSDSSCVVSGQENAIQSLKRICELQGIKAQQIHTSHAFHSQMMNSAANDFEKFVNEFSLKSPTLPIISNVTGEILQKDEAVSARYWANHIVAPVLFNKCLISTLQYQNPIIVDMGPNTNIKGFFNNSSVLNNAAKVISLHKHPKDKVSEQNRSLVGIGEIWKEGTNLNLKPLYETSYRRIALPTYVFDHKSYWIEKKTITPMFEETLESLNKKKIVVPEELNSSISIPTPLVPESYLPEDIEGKLKLIWSELFGREIINLEDDFFSLGGTSLLAIQLISHVRSQFKVELDIESLFDDPTIKGIAQQIEFKKEKDDDLLRMLLESEEINLEDI